MCLDFDALAREALAHPDNYVAPESAISPELAGLRMYDAPIFGVADANDPLFSELLQPGAVGPHFRLPGQWLPGAVRVLSFFFPFSREVKESNQADRLITSSAWLHARIEGQSYLTGFSKGLAAALERLGWAAVVPPLGEAFRMAETLQQGLERFGSPVSYTSNWSERHVAYVCGLGTFSLSKGLITEKGVSGRFGSLVTTAPLTVTPRAYSELYEYCVFCGACARNCPAEAIATDPEVGKRHAPCAAFLDEYRPQYAPRYGCGKCQVRVPCRDGIPRRKAAV